MMVTNPTITTLSVTWNPADGNVQGYKVIYVPEDGGMEIVVRSSTFFSPYFFFWTSAGPGIWSPPGWSDQRETPQDGWRGGGRLRGGGLVVQSEDELEKSLVVLLMISCCRSWRSRLVGARGISSSSSGSRS